MGKQNKVLNKKKIKMDKFEIIKTNLDRMQYTSLDFRFNH